MYVDCSIIHNLQLFSKVYKELSVWYTSTSSHLISHGQLPFPPPTSPAAPPSAGGAVAAEEEGLLRFFFS